MLRRKYTVLYFLSAAIVGLRGDAGFGHRQPCRRRGSARPADDCVSGGDKTLETRDDEAYNYADVNRPQ